MLASLRLHRKRVSSTRNPQYSIPTIRNANTLRSIASTNKPGVCKWRRAILFAIPLLMFILFCYLSNIILRPAPSANQIIRHQATPKKIIIDQHERHISQLTNIRDFMHDREQYKDYEMILLYHSSLFGLSASNSYLQQDIRDHICNITDNITSQVLLNQKILLTDNRNLQQYATGFVFHGPDSNGNSLRHKSEEPMDIYIYHNMESPAATSVSMARSDSMKHFDLLMSYQFSSDIFLPYVGRGTIKQLIDTPILLTFEEKSEIGADVAWIGSNCGAHNGRQIYLRELFKYISVHSYGACLKTQGKSWPHGKSLKDIVKKYKFYIVMENSNCKDYITEKLGAAIISSAVPIVFSVDKIPNYDYYLPPHSYINAADFSSAKELAQYLTVVGNNKTLYNEYLYYKFNAMESQKHKEIEWQNILKRFAYKETANHWCRAANAVWNYYRNVKINGVKTHVLADNSCLDKSIMTKYIDNE